jgi:hypothetical protein
MGMCAARVRTSRVQSSLRPLKETLRRPPPTSPRDPRRRRPDLSCVKLHIDREIIIIILPMQCVKLRIDFEICARRVQRRTKMNVTRTHDKNTRATNQWCAPQLHGT